MKLQHGRLRVDASFREDLNVGAIAIVDANDLVVATDIVMAANNNEAELLAIMRALQILGAVRRKNGVIETDNHTAAVAANTGRASEFPRLARQAQRLVQKREALVRLVDRGEVFEADRSARLTLRAWIAGRAKEPTWFPYGSVRTPESQVKA